MNKDKSHPIFKNPLTLEEACQQSHLQPALPYNANPVISKQPKERKTTALMPVHAFDNVYWFGCTHVGGILIDTGAGLILIDNGSDAAEAGCIAEGMKAAGFDPREIKLMMISHEHYDHYGGTCWFMDNYCPDVKVAMSRLGWNLLQTVPTEFAFVEPRPVRADILITDGMSLTLGNTSILCVHTPGHSAGCLSFIFNTTYRGQEHMVGMMGGIAVWPNQPEVRLYQNSIEYFKLFTDAAACDAFTAVHQRENTLQAVRDAWEGKCLNPWICDAADFDTVYLQNYRNMALATIKSDGLQRYQMPGSSPVPEGSPIPERHD